MITVLAWAFVTLAVVCALFIAFDIAQGRRQRMWIMNVVWPVTALYAGPLGLWVYFRLGRAGARTSPASSHTGSDRPFWQKVVVGTLHCGAGCTLGDIAAESFAVAVPMTLFGKAIFASWALAFLLAFILGIAFQYFTIKPMRDLSPGEGLKAALKADAASLTAWQVGMYGWMGFVTFVWLDMELPRDSAMFWFMMQIAMLFGFATSYPVNWWLLRSGIKEAM